MRKSIVTALGLVAALGLAAPAHAEDGGTATATADAKTATKTTTRTGTKTATRHRRAGSGHRVADHVDAPPPTGFMRLPANPVLRDCVHVTFPQCSSRGGLNPLNDGQFPLHE